MGAQRDTVSLFLCGDVMTGRGIDQILAHPSAPAIHEGFMTSALGYVQLAEVASGPIPRKADPAYIWGDAAGELERFRPDARIINLETSVTTSAHWLDKGINYRMHPANVGCLTSAGIDCCVLANNHVLDWGEEGLVETLEVLAKARLKTAGAGRDLDEARAPAVIELGRKGRIVVFSFGMETSGVPSEWGATETRAGVDLLENLSSASVRRIAERVGAVRRPNDIVIASIHWGGNWGYEIPEAHQRFARALIDEGGVDLLHGHSSHHVKGIELHRGKLILYGCGDLINDYEGIGGYEAFRSDLALLYLATLRPASGELEALELVPMQLKNFSLHRASAADARWLKETLNREGRRLGTSFELKGGLLTLRRS